MSENNKMIGQPRVHGITQPMALMSTDAPRVVQVIETSLKNRGNGTNDNPHRSVRQFYSLDGELLAEVDLFNLDAHEQQRLADYLQDRGLFKPSLIPMNPSPTQVAIDVLETVREQREIEERDRAKEMAIEDAMTPPLQALLVSRNKKVREAIAEGKITATIRAGTRKFIGGSVMLCCHVEPWAVMANIVRVIHCSLQSVLMGMSDEHSPRNEFGYKGAGDARKQLGTVYPDLKETSPVSLIYWNNVRGALVPADPKAELPVGHGRRSLRAPARA